MPSPATPPATEISPVKRALLAVEKMQAKLDAAERARTEPIAVIGMGCRFPGGASDPETFWQNLRNGVDGIRSGASRWGAAEAARVQAAGYGAACWGGFLDDIDQFDPGFFGLSRREAAGMDPQHRLLLETSWDALERAGCPPAALSGTATGVFIGICSSDYALNHLSARDGIDAYASTGTAYSLAANRLSYMLNLRGPSLAVDTACSSSLVATHLACHSLRAGECDVALAGGVNLTLLLEGSVSLAKWGMLASDGRCKTFDARADGYVRGEGCGVLVLKRLSDAQVAGDTILAVIRGSAVNQDGRSAGLTAPNLLAQQAVVQQALANAKVAPERIGYVEAHGTGTPLGDPIEIEALTAAFGPSRLPGDRCLIGSVKANIGHLEAAAGVAGLIKVILALRNGEVPPHNNFQTLNPNIALDQTPFVIPTAVTPWPRTGEPRCAGVSSFGFGGTNSHVIIEEAPEASPAPPSGFERPLHPLTVSAKSEAALAVLTARYEQQLQAPDGPATADLAYSANSGRNHHPHRAVLIGAKRITGGGATAGRLRTGFLFTGQGAQYTGMGRELYETHPEFRAALDRCAAVADPLLDRPLLGLLFDDAAPLERTSDAQPVLFALEHALASLWRVWGVEPAIVLGHSLGELAAACTAGVFSLEQGLKLAIARGRLMQQAPPGAMAAVFADESVVRATLDQVRGKIAVAAVNGPTETVVSGEDASVAALVEMLGGRGVKTKRLLGAVAFHSPLMAQAQTLFAAETNGVAYAEPNVGFVSNVTGRLASVGEVSCAEYWVRHISETVQFRAGLDALRKQNIDALIEIGPKPVLLGILRQTDPEGSILSLPSLRPGAGEWEQLLDSLGRYYVAGGNVDWAAFDRPYTRRRTLLPPYPYERVRCWLDHDPPAAAEPTVPAAWLFEVTWVPVEPAKSDRSPAGFVVIADQGAIKKGLAERLRREAPVTTFDPGSALDVPAGWEVVDLSAVDSPTDPDAVDDNCRRALTTAQAVIEASARLWVVTRGAQAAPGDDASQLALSQAPLWGLGRVLINEHPTQGGGLIDLDPAASPEAAAEALADVLLSAAPGKQWAIRGGRVLQAKIAPLKAEPSQEPVRVSPDAAYLITGGLGGLGLAVAAALAERGARRLVLMGRSAPSDEVQARLDAMAAKVHVVKGDVASREDVEEALEAVRADGTPLRGVVHCAGVLDDGVLARQTWERWPPVLAPKVVGAWNLHELTQQDPLDFFVLFSSASGVLGGPGQSNYAAANVFLDALAAFRRASGLPAVSLDWGPWAETGMSAGRKLQPGIGSIPTTSGVAAFLRFAAGPATQVMILPLDGRDFAEPLSDPAGARPEILRRLETAGPDRRAGILAAYLQHEVTTVLGLEASSHVDTHTGFLDLGVDSLMAVDLRNRLLRGLGLKDLPATVVFDHPNIASLAGYLADALFPAGETHEAAPSAASTNDPIAIVGMSCRFPGGVASPETFWELLRNGGDGITSIPPERWDNDALYDPNPDAPGKTYSRYGGFINGVDQFDPRFFGITPREAVSMDPQQRLLLEVSWEALENAGQVPGRLAGSRTGVFVGIGSNDYGQIHMQAADPRDIDVYFGTGNTASAAAGRLSFVFGLEGPSLSVDTACSSSLTAIHLACQSLRNGECHLAIAGGVQVMLSPATSIFLSRARALAADGACKVFDDSADGYVRGEGCGIVVLKRLADARAAGDEILALIGGSAVNQDGRSAGFTAPNGSAQEAVIHQALTAAGVDPREVGYLEAHGTGTPLGDPIEVRAAAAALGPGRDPARPLLLGSVKTNLGHLEAAAGVAGVIKTVLALRRREIPASLHFRKPNRHIPWNSMPVAVAAERTPWEPMNGRRVAGVSSFGISGTNAHAVLLEAPPKPTAEAPVPEGRWVLPLSARSPEALRETCRRFEAWLRSAPAPLYDICRSAAIRRTHHDHRLAVTGRDKAELADQLASRLRSGIPAQAAGRRKIAFVYSGQGSQWVGMGRTLLGQEPAFRDAVEACGRVLAAETDWRLLDVLTDPNQAALLERIDVIQPAIFAIQTGLTALWRSWGVRPDAVVGHSMGEVAAAHAAGVLCLEDAARVIARRSRLMRSLSGRGAMAQVELGMDEARTVAAARPDRLGVASSNGNRSAVLSGDPAAIDEVIAELEGRGVFARRIKVDVASHSPQMDSLGDLLAEALSGLRPQSSEIEMYSSALAKPLEAESADAAYWFLNLREPVRFAETIERMLADSCTAFLEVSPHPILTAPLAEIFADAGGVAAVFPSLRRDEDGRANLLEGLGALYAAGADPEWQNVFPQSVPHVTLPSYPWDHQRYWLEPRRRVSTTAAAGWPGRELRSPAMTGRAIETIFSLASLPWIGDHRIGDSLVVAGAAHVALMASAAPEASRFEAIEFSQALVLGEEDARLVQIAFTTQENGGTSCRIYSDAGFEWLTHASADVVAGAPPREGAPEELSAIRLRCPDPVDSDAFYTGLWDAGYELGPSFRWIEEIQRGGREALCRLRVPRGLDLDPGYRFHPGFLDCCFQLAAAALAQEDVARFAGGQSITVPVGIDALTLRGNLSGDLWCHAAARVADPTRPEEEALDLTVFDSAGWTVLTIEGFRARRVARESLGVAARTEDWLYALEWREAVAEPEPCPVDAPRSWLVVKDQGGLGADLAARLEANGQSCALLDSPELDARFLKAPLRGVIFCPALDNAEPSADDAPCWGATRLVQSMAQGAWRNPPRLFLITRRAHAVAGEESIAVAQTALWGLGRTIAIEHPEFACARIDLDKSDESTERLVAELLANTREDQVALRGRQRFVLRLTRAAVATRRPGTAFRADATYLITGGAGGVGKKVARWMIEHGARHLVLVGRSAVHDAADWPAEPGVHVLAADVSREDELDRVLTRIRRELPPLRGVIHAATVLEDGILLQMTRERFRTVMAPKVSGAWNLHRLTLEDDLDFFVTFSSLASLLGAPGQGNYSAANAFLDGLAHYRRALGLPGLSINWGPWAEIGQAAAQSNRGQRLAVRGVESLSPELGLQAFDILLRSDLAQAGVMKFNLRQWREFYPAAAESPLLAELRDLQRDEPKRLTGEMRKQLEAAHPEARLALLVGHLQEQFGQVMRINDTEIDPLVPLSNLGLDSLMGLEIRNRLESSLNLRLSATMAWTYPTISALSGHLLDRLGLRAEPAAGVHDDRSDALTAVASEIASLSDEEMEALLLKKLENR